MILNKITKLKKGISLIVLTITIIVVIILAAVVILTLSKNNPIESAKEAIFKEDVRTFQDELALYISKQYTIEGGQWDKSIDADNYDKIINYIPSFSKKYEGKFIIEKNDLKYTNKLDEKELEYIKKLNIKESLYTSSKLLPNEYKQVEYIESTGIQYIDTKYLANQDTVIETKYSFTKNLSGFLYGTRQDLSSNFYCFLYKEDYKGIRFDYNYERSNCFNSEVNTAHIVKQDKNKYYIDNIYTGEFSYSNFTSTCNMFLFAGNTNGYIDSKSFARLYYCKIWDASELVRNFVPCYSTTKVIDVNGKECPSGTVGLYDMVNNDFYTNQGIGQFVKGKDI